MNRSRSNDPIRGLTRAQRRGWRATERRLRNQHDVEQLAALLGLAASGGEVTRVTTPPTNLAGCDSGGCDPAGCELGGTPVELIIEGRRVRAVRVHRRTLAKLGEAISTIAAVPLTAVSRYGPYWVLTFRLATEQLVLLADQLTLLPDYGGPGCPDRGPGGGGPRVGLAL
jgi:hypothetical protein